MKMLYQDKWQIIKFAVSIHQDEGFKIQTCKKKKNHY